MKKCIIFGVVFVCCLFTASRVYGDVFYWIGGPGNWSEVSHWGIYSGAAYNNGLNYTRTPNANDTVIFDDNSGFTSASRRITLNQMAVCHDLRFLMTTVLLEFTGSGFDITIAGSLELQKGMYFTPRNVYFGSEATTEDDDYSIITNGQAIEVPIIFQGNYGGVGSWTTTDHFKTRNITVTGGTWIAADSVTQHLNYALTFTSGTIDWRGQYIAITTLISDNSNTRNLFIDNATIIVSGFSVWVSSTTSYYYQSWIYTGTGSMLSASGSMIEIKNSATNYYYRTLFNNQHIYPKILMGYGITGSRIDILTELTVDTLIIKAPTSITSGLTLHINEYLEAKECKNQFSFYGSGGIAYIDMGSTANNVDINHILIQNLAISGSSLLYPAVNCTDGEGNSGWNFITSTAYWVGGAGYWTDSLHWASTSGGMPGSACMPTGKTNVVFDQYSGFTATSKTVTVNAAAYCLDMTWNGIAENPDFNINSYLYIYGSLEWQQGMNVTLGSTTKAPGWIVMRATDSRTITSNNVIIAGGQDPGYSALNVDFNGTGTWTMLDDFSVEKVVYFTKGNIVMKNINVSLGAFVAGVNSSDQANARSLDISGSTITLNNRYLDYTNVNPYTWFYIGANASLLADNSHIIMNYRGSSYLQNRFYVISAHKYAKVSFPASGDITNGATIDELIIENANTYLRIPQSTTINKRLDIVDCKGFKELSGQGGTQTNLTMGVGATVNINHAKVSNIRFWGTPPYTAYNTFITNTSGLETQNSSTGTHYWVGGAGNWNDSLHWAATSGGTPGNVCIPTPGDDVVFDENSGFTAANYIVTVNTSAFCNSMTWHNMELLDKPTLTMSQPIYVSSGSVEWQQGMSITGTGAIVMSTPISITANLKNNGVIMPNLTFNGAGTLHILDDMTVTGAFLMQGGGAILNMSNIHAVLGYFYASASNQSIDIQNSVIELNGSYDPAVWYIRYATNAFSAANSTLILNGSNATYNGITCPTNHIYGNVIFRKSGILNSNLTIDSLFVGDENISNIALSIVGGRTITITSHIKSVDCQNLKTFRSNNTTRANIAMQTNADVNMDHTTLSYLNFTGNIPYTVNNCMDGGGNVGLTFGNVGKTYYWVNGKGDWNDLLHWDIVSGGNGNTGCVPLMGDNVIFDENSGFLADGDTVIISTPAYCKNMTWHNMPYNFPHLQINNQLNIYGSLEWQQNMTVNTASNNNSYILFRSPDTVTITSNGVFIGKTGGAPYKEIEFSSTSGKWTMTDDFQVTGQFHFTDGDIDMSGINVSMGGLYSNNNNTRFLDISNSTVRITFYVYNSGSYAWGYIGNNNALSAAGSTLYMVYNGGMYNNYFHASPTHHYHKIIFEQSGHINCALSTTVDTLIIKENSGITVVVNGSINVTEYFESLHCNGFNTLGTSSSASNNVINMVGDAKVNVRHLNIVDGAITGSNAPYKAYSSFNVNNRAGWDVSEGVDMYWVGGAGDWSDPLHWASTSGGTGGSVCTPPTASDNVFFDENSGFHGQSDRAVKYNTTINCKNMTWHNMDELDKPTMTLTTHSGGVNIYGSLELQQGMVFTGSLSFAMLSKDSVTIKTNGVAFNSSLWNGFSFSGGGSYKLLDNLTTNELTFSSGRLYLNDVNLLIKNFTGTGSIERTLDITNSNITVGTWNYSGSNLTLLADTSRINISGALTGISTHTYDTIVFTGKGTIANGTVLNTLIFAQGFNGADPNFAFPAGGTVTINRKIITGGTPCEMVRLTSTSTTPANINVPASAYNIEQTIPIGFDIHFAKVSYIHIVEGSDKAKVRLSNQSDIAVVNSLTGNWEIVPYEGLKGVTLGNDTSMWCNATFPIYTDHFYGDHNTQYLWNDNSTANTLVITDFGDYWVKVSYSPTCSVSDTIHVSRDSNIVLSGTVISTGSQAKVSLSTSGRASLDPNPVFVLDSVQPSDAMTGLPIVQTNPDFYFSKAVKAFFSHTDSLSGCSDTFMITTPLIAVNDTSFKVDDTVAIISLLDNDIYMLEMGGCTSASTALSNTIKAQHGTAQIIHDTLIYTPYAGWTGLDSLHYVLTVCGKSDTAAVYLVTVKDTFSACPSVSVTMTLPNIPGMTYSWYEDTITRTFITGTNTYTVTKDSPEDIHVWWIEASWDGSKLPTLPLYLMNGSASTATHISGFNGDTLIGANSTATLEALSVSEVINPVFHWYKDETGGAPFHTGETYTTSSLTADTTFYVAISGDNYCTSIERKAITVHVIPPPEAVNDYFTTLVNTPVICDILSNDIIPAECTNPIIDTVPFKTFGGLNGSVSIENGVIIYTPRTGYSGIQRMDYTVKCGTVITNPVGRASIIVLNPLSQSYYACPDAVVTLGFSSISSVTLNWYDVPVGGNPIASNANTITRTKDNSGQTQSYWVEPVYNSVSYPRIQVDLQPGDCGVLNPVGCAATGTILFKEDFGGNNVSDADIVSQANLPQISGYGYNSLLNTEGVYSIAKRTGHYSWNSAAWYMDIDDHTYPNDPTRGYFIGFNASNSAGQFYTYQIDNLCGDIKLYFSAWLTSLTKKTSYSDKVNTIFRIEDTGGKILAIYYTGNIPDADPNWKNYGFEFTVPTGQSSIVLKIINNVSGSSGNDFVIDDIEVRLCAPPVTLTQPTNRDTTLCSGSSFTFSGAYTDDGTFTNGGEQLVYRWEYNISSDVNNPAAWVTVTGTENSTGNLSLTSSYQIDSVKLSDTGYYRLVVANGLNMGNYYCRAMSEIVHLGVNKSPTFDVKDTTGCHIELRGLVSNISVNSTVLYYADSLLTEGLYATLKPVSKDTVYYVVSRDTNTGCFSAVRPVRIKMGVYPASSPTTGASVVCTGNTIDFTNPSPEGGRWKVSNTTLAEIVNPLPNSVTIKGLSKGQVFLSYIMGENCTTVVTSRIKIITPSDKPTIIIGIER